MLKAFEFLVHCKVAKSPHLVEDLSRRGEWPVGACGLGRAGHFIEENKEERSEMRSNS